MQNTPTSHLREILIGLFVTIVGGVIVAWIIREGELFSSTKPPEKIVIPITNNNCTAHDIYIDGVPIALDIEPNKTAVISTTNGAHILQICQNGDVNNCESPIRVQWTNDSEYTISPSSDCPITITLSNKACKIDDFYVDNVMVVSALAPGNSAKFSISPGTHSTKVCDTGTSSCTDPIEFEWLTSTEHSITTKKRCPITITLSNKACRIDDFYVDNVMVVSALAPGNSAKFSISPGTHSTKVCDTGTNNCTDPIEFEWLTSTEHSITTSVACP